MAAHQHLYNSGFWKRRRALQRRLEPLCRMCAAEGRVEAAACVDHVEAHCGDVNRFVRGELQSLCLRHHNAIKQQIEKLGYSKAVDPISGWPLDERHPSNQPREKSSPAKPRQ